MGSKWTENWMNRMDDRLMQSKWHASSIKLRIRFCYPFEYIYWVNNIRVQYLLNWLSKVSLPLFYKAVVSRKRSACAWPLLKILCFCLARVSSGILSRLTNLPIDPALTIRVVPCWPYVCSPASKLARISFPIRAASNRWRTCICAIFRPVRLSSRS